MSMAATKFISAGTDLWDSDGVRIAIFGLGYVGCVSAACLAKMGNQVIGVDKDQHKIAMVQQGEAPFHEPGLNELVAEAVHSGRLTATLNVAEALVDTDIALLCVGTPSDADGNLDMTFLRRVCKEIAGQLEGRTKRLIVTTRSTVFPGVNEQLYHEVFAYHPGVSIVSNPEFLREGTAIKDFFEPSLIVVGGVDASAVDQVANLYTDLPCPVQKVQIRTAEMIKYACNAFHAVKIAFANEIGSVCAQQGISGSEVMRVVCQDTKLNISSAYLRPGFAFGGSCLPKDLRALNYRAKEGNVEIPLLRSTLPSNQYHLERLTRRVNELTVERIGIYGLTFKADTDDLRESPVIQLIERLLAQGRRLRVYDPHLDLRKIHGSNQRYLFDVLPHIGQLMTDSVEALLDWSEHIALTQKPPLSVANAINASGKPILNLAE